MTDGQKYANGMLEGFLSGRVNAALSMSLDTKGEKRAAYLKSASYGQRALLEYEVNGDSDEVRSLTGLSMDWMDKAISIA